MTGEKPDLAGQRITLREGLVVLGALIGLGVQALYIVSSVSEFKGKLASERQSDVARMEAQSRTLETLVERLSDMDKTVTRIDAKVDSQNLLLTDSRERISDIEDQLRTTK